MTYHDLAISQIEEGKRIKKRFNNRHLPGLSSCVNGVQKGRYYLIGADPGVGKTTLADQMFMLDILLDMYENPGELDVEIHYFSLELAVGVKILKLLSYKLWIDYAVCITPDLLTDKSLNEKIEQVIRTKYKGFLDFIEEKVTFYTEGTIKSIDASLTKVIRRNGEIVDGVYIEHNPNKIVITIIDHIGLLKGPGDRSKKIEVLSARMVFFRNNFNITPVMVQQFNRTANSVERQKFNPTPQRDDFKDSSNTYEDKRKTSVSLKDN